MDKLPLNLIVFATTMGHKGRHTYGKAIDSLFSQIEPDLFTHKVMHLKTREGEDAIAEEIKKYCYDKHIRIIETKEDMVHHSENHKVHSEAYFKDIFKAYSDLEVRKTKYSLWLEDDWVLRLKGVDLKSGLSESLSFLDDNPDQLCVRFNAAEKFEKSEGGHFMSGDNIFTQTEEHSKYGPCFTFQPNINRTSEFFLAWKTLQHHLSHLASYHCELMATHMLIDHYTNSKTPFSFFDPEKIYSEHIG